MATGAIVAIVIVVIVVAAVLIVLTTANRRRRLRERFGPEYDRAVTERGSSVKQKPSWRSGSGMSGNLISAR